MYLTFEESFVQICIFLQKGLEGVVCHSNFAHAIDWKRCDQETYQDFGTRYADLAQRLPAFAGFCRFYDFTKDAGKDG